MIKDYQKWFPVYYIKQTASLGTRMLSLKHQKKFLISTYHQFECSSDSFGTIAAYEFIDELICDHFRLRKGNSPDPKLPSALKGIAM
ncbi:hypothetical protein TNCV_2611321 [Trichonephila clavipes]|nr:hypothetical protein TNCV_2611321 [Trichonephila clavipes]